MFKNSLLLFMLELILKNALLLYFADTTRTSQAQLEITIATANTATLQATTFALLDVVVIIDVESKTIMVMNLV